MTVSAGTAKAGPYTGNGVTSAFAFAFKVFADSDIRVVLLDVDGLETDLTLNTDYTVARNADQDNNPGGTVTYKVGGVTTAVPSGYKLTVVGDFTYSQPTDLPNGGAFFAAVVENALDRVTLLVKQAKERLDSALTLPVSVTGVTAELPIPEANKLIGWNDDGTELQNMDASTLATITAFGTANADVFDGDGATTQFTLSDNPGALNNLDVSIGGVTQTPGADYTWTSGTTITFIAAPPSGTGNVLVRYLQGLPQGYTNANLVSYDPGGSGAADRTVEDKLRETVSFTDRGAVGDGVTDDTDAVNAALALGKTVTGGGLTYAVNGQITLPASAHIRDAAFIQLDPAGSSSRRTLYQSAGTLCWLENVKVDRNGDGSGGDASDAAGIYLSGTARVVMTDVEVTGDDKGTGILVADCDDVTIDRAYVHDMKHGTSGGSDPGDDKMQGIWLIRGNRAVLNSPRVESLHSLWSGQPEFNRYSRGIAVSGTENFTINAPLIYDVDQGIDISGDENPQYFSIVGGAVEECYTWGVKCANSTQEGTVLGTTAKRCGIAGFVASAPTVVMTYQTQRLDFIGCKAIASGYGDVWQATQNVCGFRVAANAGAGYPDYPRSVRFISCTSTASGATTEYGFVSDATLTANGDLWVEAIDCTSIGHTVQAYYGFHQGITTRQTTGTQSIPNNSWTDVTWDSNVVDRMDGDNGTAAQIKIRRAGLYLVCAGLEFASGSATGTRGLRLTRNGSAHVGAYERIPAGDTNSKAVVMSFPILCDEGDTLAAQAFQDSGGAINISAGCAMSAALISPGQGRT